MALSIAGSPPKEGQAALGRGRQGSKLIGKCAHMEVRGSHVTRKQKCLNGYWNSQNLVVTYFFYHQAKTFSIVDIMEDSLYQTWFNMSN